MIRNVKLTVQYDGTDYRGFQRQTKCPNTIQGILERNISKVFDKQIRITAAGRTDAGVHAIGQVINFYVDSTIPTDRIGSILNKRLPNDIVISEVEDVCLSFHSRRNAVSRIYNYLFYQGKHRFPGIDRYSLRVDNRLNIINAKKATDLIRVTKDFSSCMSSGSTCKSTIKQIYNCDVRIENSYLNQVNENFLFTIEADSFLYNMVRILVANVIRVAYGIITLNEFDEILNSKDRKCAGVMAPANGLYLAKVRY